MESSVDWRQETCNYEDVKFKTPGLFAALSDQPFSTEAQGTESCSLEGGFGPRQAARPSSHFCFRETPHNIPHPRLSPTSTPPNIECHTESARDLDLCCNQRRGNGFAAGFAAAGHMSFVPARERTDCVKWSRRPLQNTNLLVDVELQLTSLTPCVNKLRKLCTLTVNSAVYWAPYFVLCRLFLFAP